MSEKGRKGTSERETRGETPRDSVEVGEAGTGVFVHSLLPNLMSEPRVRGARVGEYLKAR